MHLLCVTAVIHWELETGVLRIEHYPLDWPWASRGNHKKIFAQPEPKFSYVWNYKQVNLITDIPEQSLSIKIKLRPASHERHNCDHKLNIRRLSSLLSLAVPVFFHTWLINVILSLCMMLMIMMLIPFIHLVIHLFGFICRLW